MELTTHMLEAAAASSPLFRDLFLVAAIPRTFDRSLLAAMISLDEGDPDYVGAFERLVDSPLVYECHGMNHAIQGRVRRSLLDYWMADSQRAEELSKHLQSLQSLYDHRYAEVQAAAVALRESDAVLRRINQLRATAFAESIEDSLIRTAVELVHTGLRRSSDTGWSAMVNTFNDLEGAGLYNLCDLLVRAWKAEEDTALPPPGPLHKAWGGYFSARVANARGLWSDALAALESIPDPESLDLKYATWYHSEKTEALRGLSRFREALNETDRELAIHERHHVDDWNAARVWLGKGNLYGKLWESEGEIASSEKAVRWAERHGSRAQRIAAGLQLSSSLHAALQRTKAVERFFQVLKEARSSLIAPAAGLELQATTSIPQVAMELFGSTSPRLLAVLAEQHRQLSLLQGSETHLDGLLAQAEAWLRGGDRVRAAEVYREAHSLAEARSPGRIADIEACAATAQGQPILGAEAGLRLLNRPLVADDPWMRARVWTNAAIDFIAGGSYDRAKDCISTARPIWEAMDHRHAVGFSYAILAEIMRRTGDLSGARDAMEFADTGFARGYEGDRYEYMAKLAQDEGEYSKGLTYAQRAAEVAASLGNAVDSVQRSLLALSCLVAARNLTDTRAAHADLGVRLDSIACFVEWQRTAESSQANEHAGRAVRILTTGAGPLSARSRSAVEHLEVAISIESDVEWYWIEAALAESAAGRSHQASERLKQAVQLTRNGILRPGLDWLMSTM